MKAIGYRTHGGPEVLEVLDLPEPVCGPGQVLVRVRAAAVNPTDTMRRAGASQGDGLPYVPGMDVAGTVEAVAADAQTDLGPGDAVMAVVVPSGAHGAYAEKVALPAESVVRAPQGLSPAEAASLPMNALTARLALDVLDLEAGAAVAVTGAAGAFGGHTVELAKADGLAVVADASAADEELVASLGADHVLRRGKGFAEAVRTVLPDGAAGVIDGAVQLEDIVPAAADGATVVTIRGDKGEHERGVRFWSISVAKYARRGDLLDEIRALAEAGRVTPRVADVLPADDAAEAHRRLEAGGVRGRQILQF